MLGADELAKRDCSGTNCPDGCYNGVNDVCCSGGGAVPSGDVCCDDKAGGGCARGLTCGFCGDDGVCCSDSSCTVLVNTDGASVTPGSTVCTAAATVPPVSPVGPTPPPVVTPPPAFSVNPNTLTCGWINGDPKNPYTCQPKSTCVVNDEYGAFACCNSKGSCDFRTVCEHGGALNCQSKSPGDCFHWTWTVECIGGGGHCVTATMPGKPATAGGTTTVGYLSADCRRSTDITTVLPTYTGGPKYAQYPMAYSVYSASVSPKN